MTELAAAVDDNDELWTLDNLPTPEAPYVEVESEKVEVRSRFPSSYYTLTGETLPPRIRVRRGVAGTTKASHIQGSTLTPNYGLGSGAGAGGVTVDNLDDPPAEVTTLIAPGAVITGDEADLSGVLRLRLLGPYSVAFNTADISAPGTGHKLADLPSGTLVTKAWAEVAQNWTGADAAIMSIFIGGNGDWENGDWIPVIESDVASSGSLPFAGVAPGSYATVDAAATPDIVNESPCRLTTAGALGVWVDITNGPAVAGSADIYALIAEPSA